MRSLWLAVIDDISIYCDKGDDEKEERKRRD